MAKDSQAPVRRRRPSSTVLDAELKKWPPLIAKLGVKAE
jgi:hypothetical protein